MTYRKHMTHRMHTAQARNADKRSSLQSVGRLVLSTGVILSLGIGPLHADTIADTPLPLLNGTERARVVYTATGVFDSSDLLVTSFVCSSTERTGGREIIWGVEVFQNGVVQNNVVDGDGANGQGVATLQPGDTDTISTRDGPFDDGNDDLDGPNVRDGSARILATSAKIICTAYLSSTTSPPAFVTTLPLFRGTRQRGQ